MPPLSGGDDRAFLWALVLVFIGLPIVSAWLGW
jgi:hypothetical protein